MSIVNETNNFFKEWQDSKSIIPLSGFMTILMFLSLIWIWNVIPGEVTRAGVFLWMLLGAAIAAGIDVMWEKNWIWGYNDYGKNVKAFAIALLAGAIFSFILQLGNFNISTLAVTSSTALLGFYYIVVVAPYVEEKFFRGWLEPTFGLLLSKTKFLSSWSYLLGVILSSITFAFFHFAVYGAAINLLFTAFIFGVLMSIGNHTFKSRGFSIAAHIINNFIVIGGFTYLIGLI